MESADVGAIADALDGVGVAEGHAADWSTDAGGGGDVLDHAFDGAGGEWGSGLCAGKEEAVRRASVNALLKDAKQGVGQI